ncbi:MAG TPA: methylated-DNA--[protein]-cysteine S-methyltransferase [Vicinamibacterales bacterium]|nr:methylated-DNA--[protein]-cysteine S-methyltransferase [Vicinamibacterales bacterium]
MILSRATVETPLGPMLALASERGLCALEFTRCLTPTAEPGVRHPTQQRLPKLDARLKRHFPPHQIIDRESDAIARARQWLERYFHGAAAAVDDLPLDMHGADFERRVWQALLTIPPGETRSYGALAHALGSPGAARAVGLANGANPIAIIVPCHRVIGSNGSLTGYGGGLDRKTWLLDHERRWRRDQLF